MRVVPVLAFVVSVGFAVAGVLDQVDFLEFVFLEIFTLIAAGVYATLEDNGGYNPPRK